MSKRGPNCDEYIFLMEYVRIRIRPWPDDESCVAITVDLSEDEPYGGTYKTVLEELALDKWQARRLITHLTRCLKDVRENDALP